MRNWLREIRLSSNISQEQIITEANITRQAYWLIENDQRNPSVETAKAIARVLGFNWTRFFEEEEKQ